MSTRMLTEELNKCRKRVEELEKRVISYKMESDRRQAEAYFKRNEERVTNNRSVEPDTTGNPNRKK
ncbi:hypothetical protein GpSGHVEth155 [Glossina pallidipes salivary gland hypertrophy virus]|uniref:Uncharacterized protein n=2 Tax=Glossina hytrovirus (isolate Glossina pallidipes/Ethiopia/Seibersdorf/-) TaxID=379529 RepID=A0A109QSF7_GHVS|nr:hypothetical protein SGHV139 [Glossina pallidipes salivary gland hypertrophy virus]ABQ08912.1 hypothetical protein SGHV139 [Glossina pallidipes salivary gland hypertrophy virus]AMB48759.1 hypothetical protein GpSGHVEth155 [Glossina pallidipes salivary gland hypertrophy virus]